ncbi:unnamed protein product [Gongylonema pulchrum]|uniref:CDT1 domain-containing protein n=1 Tax=Gongylonema pulchrum TaxID=637853 RepID=A0A183D1J6_9BILA|nr:unnamed protein product [Gongylonema pulchrum]
MLPREMQGILACCSPVPLHVKQELHALHRIISTARDQPLVKRAVSAPTIGTLTFENVVSQIRNIAYEKFGGGKDLESGNKSNNPHTASPSPDVYIIGETGFDQETKQRLAKVLKMLEEWATPFECYRITMMEKKSNAVEQEAEKPETEKSGTEVSSGKKLWSHFDPATNRGPAGEKTSDGTNLEDGAQCKSEKEVIYIEEVMTLTEKERRKKRKRVLF